MPIPLITALEIGTTTVKVLMGEVREDGGLMVVGMGEHASRGVHKGEIVDFGYALNAVNHALEEAEASANRSIGESIYLAVSGGGAKSRLHTAEIPILNEYEEAGGEVTPEDVEHLLGVARKVPLAEGFVGLHTLQQNFVVDGRGGIANPERMLAETLSVGMLSIQGRQATVENLKKLLQSVPVICSDAAFSGFCSAVAVLTPEQKRAGAVVIDLGGGTTSYIVYHEGLVKLAGSIAVGGNHVTEDIGAGLNINRRQAEALKKESGSAVVNRMDGDQNFSIPAEGGFSGRVVRSATLNLIIHARMEETFRLISDQIEESGLSGVLSAGVMLVGGGSALEGVSDLAQQVFNAPAQMGHVQDCVGLSTKKEGARFAAVVGAIRYAALQMEDEPQIQGRMREWFLKVWGGSR